MGRAVTANAASSKSVPIRALFLAFLALGLGSALARADDCTDVDMRAAGGSMEGIQPMSQGQHGICYSYSAAELADSWTCKNLSPRTPEAIKGMHRTSPIALATSARAGGFNREKGKSNCGSGPGKGCSGISPLDSGWAGDCVNYLRSSGGTACDERLAFGESTITYDVVSSKKDDYEIFPGAVTFTTEKKTVTKTGLGMGGTFYAGKIAGSSTEHEAGFSGRDSDYLTALLKAYDDYHALLDNPIPGARDAADRMSLQLTCDLYATGLPEGLMLGTLTGNLNPVLRDLFTASKGETKTQFLKRYLDAACKGKNFAFAPPLPALHEEHFHPEDGKHNDDAIVNYLNQRLSKPGAMPIEIGYCASVLYGGNKFVGLAQGGPVEVVKSDGSKENTRCLRKAGTDANANTAPTAKKGGDVSKRGTQADPSDHSSLVVGRKRAKSGACMFLVRNSWGASCERYASKDAGYECEEATGDVWIDATKLASSIQDVSHFTP